MDDANRIATFTAYLSNQVAQGKRIEYRSDFFAVLVSGKPVCHAIHFTLTVLTLGICGAVWLWRARQGGERRELVQVDQWGFSTRTPFCHSRSVKPDC